MPVFPSRSTLGSDAHLWRLRQQSPASEKREADQRRRLASLVLGPFLRLTRDQQSRLATEYLLPTLPHQIEEAEHRARAAICGLAYEELLADVERTLRDAKFSVSPQAENALLAAALGAAAADAISERDRAILADDWARLTSMA